MASLLVAMTTSSNRQPPPAPVDFFDGSGAVATVFSGLGLPAPSFVPESLPFLAPGRAARVVTASGVVAGWVGVLSRELAVAWDLAEAVVGEIDLGALPPFEMPLTVDAPSRFPGSEVDLTVTHRAGRAYAELEAAVRRGAPAALEAVTVRSRYRGPGVPDGFVKTSISLTFGASDRSLSREDVNAWRDGAARRILSLGETRVDGIA